MWEGVLAFSCFDYASFFFVNQELISFVTLLFDIFILFMALKFRNDHIPLFLN